MSSDSFTQQLTFYLLDGYTVPSYIAEGSYGAVWKSTRPVPGSDGVMEDVAIKVIRDIASVNRMVRDSDRSVYLKRIYREIEVMSLFHACEEFVHLLDLYLSPDGKDLFLVMPFVDHSLSSVLSHEGVANVGLPEPLTRYIIMQVLVALSRMEACKCIHRDLSLSNILVEGEHYAIYLADFGLSRAHYEPGYDMTNVDIVTLPYRPPEIALRGASLSNKIDIWSLGIVAVECLNGAPFLHGAKDDVSQLKMIVERVDRPSALDDSVRTMMSEPALQYLKSNWGYIGRLEPNIANHLSSCRPSPECLDVLRAMLRFHPNDRKSASELLQMPWFTECGDDAVVMRELLDNPNAPTAGFSCDVENASFEEMLASIHRRCEGRVPTQKLELVYEGRHYDR